MSKTYFLRDTARSVGWVTAVQELASELTTGASNTVTASCAAGATTNAFIWSTPTNEPNSADWPSGDFHLVINVSAIGADLSLAGAALRIMSGDTNSSPENGGGSWDTTTGTGLHTASTTNDFAAGSASDRYCAAVTVTNGSMHAAEDITVTVNTSDTFMDGPWTAGPAASLLLPNRLQSPLLRR